MRNRSSGYVINLGSIFKYSAYPTRICSRRENISKKIELICFLDSRNRCIVCELCTRRSYIDIVSISENIRSLSRERDSIASFDFCLDDMSKSSIILINSRITIRSALFLGCIVITRVFDSSDTIDDSEIIRIIKGLKRWSISS